MILLIVMLLAVIAVFLLFGRAAGLAVLTLCVGVLAWPLVLAAMMTPFVQGAAVVLIATVAVALVWRSTTGR